ncbi:hypothetical protein BcepSauron_279 [Burkholderia phage BcepSauron]|uniref:Uncharacterized protein n=1 Tax=Burkholderia phage BcepSauron TaxID=2530033 RepID=A0A482MLW8_9CAUD|nr:hypothetical protein H1O17_gp279 [Burkholderia phage BcepSauron]QBQ74659.1 hypothetical protein BcepSauron_279 [Burkholderia phage BcepSauron]
MSLKYMQGFETTRDDSDLRLQNWSVSPQAPTTKKVTFAPSVTNVPGTSLRPVGAFQSSAASSALWGAAADQTWGYYNTGYTVQQAWNAGGITLGFGAKLNSNAGYYVSAALGQGCGFDGTRYWGFRRATGTNISTSPDLINWTDTPAQISGALAMTYSQTSSVPLVVSNTSTNTTAINYSTNNGSSWTNVALPVTPSASVSSPMCPVDTGNSAFPHVVPVISNTSSGFQGIMYAMVGDAKKGAGNFTLASSGGGATQAINAVSTVSRLLGGSSGVVALFYSGYGLMAVAANSALNTSGAWTSFTVTATGWTAPGPSGNYITDMAFLPAANRYVFATNMGLMYATNPGGTPGTPSPLSGTVTMTLGLSLPVLPTQLILVGSTLYAVTNGGSVYSTLDGVTWTLVGTPLTNVATGGYTNYLYDGSKYVLFSSSVTGIIATTPDMVTNWQALNVYEALDATATGLTGGVGSGLVVSASGAPAANGQFTVFNTYGGFLHLFVAGASGGNRQWGILDSVGNSTTYLTGSLSATSNLYHYFEMRYVKNSASVNQFDVYMYIDGVQIGSKFTYQFTRNIDTTGLFLIGFQRSGCFTAIDDIYVTLEDGTGLSGNLGQINIAVQRPDADVQAQWVPTGGSGTNASAVNQAALSSLSSKNVASSNSGDVDVYSSADTIPAGYTARAQLVETYFTKTSTTAPVVSVGLRSSGAETDSSQVTVSGTTPAYVSVLSDIDPNGNKAWTTNSIKASQFALNHIT